jgi:hypothetical protein
MSRRNETGSRSTKPHRRSRTRTLHRKRKAGAFRASGQVGRLSVRAPRKLCADHLCRRYSKLYPVADLPGNQTGCRKDPGWRCSDHGTGRNIPISPGRTSLSTLDESVPLRCAKRRRDAPCCAGKRDSSSPPYIARPLSMVYKLPYSYTSNRISAHAYEYRAGRGAA